MGILYLHRDVPEWLLRVAERTGLSVDPFDPRSVTSRGDPLVLLLDVRGEQDDQRCKEVRRGFGPEPVLVVINGDGVAPACADAAVMPSEQAVSWILPLATSLARERRSRKVAESQLVHARRRSASYTSISGLHSGSSPGFSAANALLAKARLGVVQFDGALRCISWNRFMESRTGVGASEVLGKQIEEHAVLTALGLQQLAELALAGEMVEGDDTCVEDAGGGRLLWIRSIASPVLDDSGQVTGVAIVIHDRTPQRVAEQIAKSSERDLQALIEVLPDAAIVSRERRILYANKTAADIFGCDAPDKLLGTNLLDWICAEDRPIAEAQVAAMTGGGAPSMFEVAVARATQPPPVVEVAVAGVPFEGERAMLFLARDVTDRKKIQAKLAATDRLASMGMLAAGVAHEINNPLTALVSSLDFFSELLEERDDLGDAEELADVLLTAQEATRRVREIVRDLRLFSRPEEERRSLIDVRHVLESTARLARGEVRHRARLIKDFGDLPMIDGNAARLGQVLLNLVVNAAHAIDDGEADQNSITLRTRGLPDGRACIEVVDTGRGIAPEHLPHIFEPFFSTKPIGVGTGLGLAVCHRIVASLDGVIEVDSAPGEGTTFRVILPPGKRSPSAAPPRSLPPPMPPRRGRVLVVDDDLAVRRTMVRILCGDHDVTTVNCGREAVELVKGGDRFDVVLCDLMMPMVSGDQCWELVANIDREQAERFVFVTGGAMAPRARLFLDATSQPTLDKPFDAETLRRAVRAAL